MCLKKKSFVISKADKKGALKFPGQKSDENICLFDEKIKNEFTIHPIHFQFSIFNFQLIKT